MLNDVLAVCVAGIVVVVIATILGAVELLQKAVAVLPVGCSRCPLESEGENERRF